MTGFAYKLKVANSPVADDINKTVVLAATISGGENTEPLAGASTPTPKAKGNDGSMKRKNAVFAFILLPLGGEIILTQ